MNPYTIPGIIRKQKTPVEKIKDKVCEYYGIEALSEKKWAQQVAVYLTRKTTGKSLRDIAEDFKVSKGSVTFSIKKVGDEMSVYPEKKKEVKQLKDSL